MSRSTRVWRYGLSIAVALFGVLCGIVLNGTLAGTLATILIGLGLVGVVSLLFYDVGLSEDRDRASTSGRPAPPDPHDAGHRASPAHADERPEGGAAVRRRPLERRRGERRRLR